MALDIRTLTSPDELPDWLRAVSVGFLRTPEVTDEAVAALSPDIELTRTQGAFDGGRCVGTFRTTPQQLTVPGGESLPSCAVTNVTVSPTHRRRGLLTRMMDRALVAAKERGDAFSSLIAAEYPIYGRYGYGPAAWTAEWEVEVARSGLDPRHSGPSDGGRVDLSGPEEMRRIGPSLYERYRAQPHRQGVIDRPERWWLVHTGERRFPGDEFTPPFFAVHRDADGEPQGLLSYTVRERWDGKLPQNTAEVQSLTALTPAAERALWHFVLSIDWVTRVRSGNRAPDDLLPLLLPDPRAARPEVCADFLWIRPLDVKRMLETRSYAAQGALVLDVHDAAGLAGGRFRLEAGPDGASCVPAGPAEADLVLDVGELGTIFLGDESVGTARITGPRRGTSRGCRRVGGHPLPNVTARVVPAGRLLTLPVPAAGRRAIQTINIVSTTAPMQLHVMFFAFTPTLSSTKPMTPSAPKLPLHESLETNDETREDEGEQRHGIPSFVEQGTNGAGGACAHTSSDGPEEQGRAMLAGSARIWCHLLNLFAI